MKVVVLGDPVRYHKDEVLLKEFEKKFEKVTYVPITLARFEISDKPCVAFNDEDLSGYDFVFPIPTIRHKEFFYTALRILSDVPMPFTPSKYLILHTSVLLRAFLRSKKLKVGKVLVVGPKVEPERLTKFLKYPLFFIVNNKKITINSRKTFEEVLSLISTDKYGMIEFPSFSKNMVYNFVIREEIFSYIKIRKKYQKIKTPESVDRIIKRVKEILELDYFWISIDKKENSIKRLSISPNFAKIAKIFGKKPIELLASLVREKTEANYKRLKIFKTLKRLIK